MPELVSDKDLAYKIPPEDFAYFSGGPEAGWLPISRMPKDLRPGGTIYLQIDAELVAQARVKGVGFREQRWDHTAPDATTDLGPGATLELDGGWSGASIDLGPDGTTPVTGYRYLIERNAGSCSSATRIGCALRPRPSPATALGTPALSDGRGLWFCRSWSNRQGGAGSGHS